MFFAITALGVSAVQILIGVAIGMSLRKNRQRQVVTEVVSRAADWQRTSERPSHALPAEARNQSDAGSIAPAELVGTGPPLSGSATKSELATGKKSGVLATDQRATAALQRTPTRQTVDEPVVVPSGKDRRMSLRREFEYRQSVAPYHGGLLPGKASFREVECQDISSTGFSFLSSQLPDFDSIVVALGVAPDLVYLQAQIVNRFQVNDGPAPLYRIGCRFAGQVSQ
jgi:hypothetical protein